MASMVSIFFGPEAGLDSAARAIERMLGRTPASTRNDLGQRYTWRILNMEVTAFDEHGLVDDCGIEFTSFPLEIDLILFDSSAAMAELDVVRTALAFYMAARLSKELSTNTIVVRNLQTKLKTYSLPV